LHLLRHGVFRRCRRARLRHAQLDERGYGSQYRQDVRWVRHAQVNNRVRIDEGKPVQLSMFDIPPVKSEELAKSEDLEVDAEEPVIEPVE